MPLHTIVGFVADFPVREDGVEPAGKELAEFAHALLTKAGFNPSAPQDHEGWAWDMSTRDGELHVTTVIGLVDDMESKPPRQWLITNDCSLPLFKRLFRKAELKAKQESLLRRLCETLQVSMSGDTRFSHITWHDKHTFDRPGDVPSTEP
jgi:hypothetical protein